MGARTPEEVDRLFATALNGGDLEGLVALYEPQASLTPQPGTTVTGTAAIREALSVFVNMKPRMPMAPRVVAQTGDMALVSAQWQLSANGPDGKPAQMTGSSIEVLRLQPDGSWRFVIDEPFGVGA
ncbi:MAG: DUF4440 domain-containing protein [Pseudomonadota bacterium]|nr:DUF4440 domain-containing protein [Pseudomonadota bacterium]